MHMAHGKHMPPEPVRDLEDACQQLTRLDAQYCEIHQTAQTIADEKLADERCKSLNNRREMLKRTILGVQAATSGALCAKASVAVATQDPHIALAVCRDLIRIMA